MNKSIIDMQIEDIAEANNISIEEAAHVFKNQSEYTLDLNNLPKVEHNWIKRGIKVSCEGANHPHHSHFLKKR